MKCVTNKMLLAFSYNIPVFSVIDMPEIFQKIDFFRLSLLNATFTKPIIVVRFFKRPIPIGPPNSSLHSRSSNVQIINDQLRNSDKHPPPHLIPPHLIPPHIISYHIISHHTASTHAHTYIHTRPVWTHP